MSELKSVLVLHPERRVPPEGAVLDGAAEVPPGLRLDALVASSRPTYGVLKLSTRQVNYKNNRVLINGQAVGYLRGPGHGRAAGDFDEVLSVPEGHLVPGVNRIEFLAGRDVSHGETGNRYDNYMIENVRLEYSEHAAAPGPPLWFAALGLMAALAGLVLALRRR